MSGIKQVDEQKENIEWKPSLGDYVEVKEDTLYLWEGQIVKIIGINKRTIAITGKDINGYERETIFSIDEIRPIEDSLEMEVLEDRDISSGERVYPVEHNGWLKNFKKIDRRYYEEEKYKEY